MLIDVAIIVADFTREASFVSAVAVATEDVTLLARARSILSEKRLVSSAVIEAFDALHAAATATGTVGDAPLLVAGGGNSSVSGLPLDTASSAAASAWQMRC